MKATLSLIALLCLTGCMSVFQDRIGMTEKQWLRTTLIADVAYMEGNVKAYKSNGAYYYFRDGVLVRVDQGMLPAQQLQVDVSIKPAT